MLTAASRRMRSSVENIVQEASPPRPRVAEGREEMHRSAGGVVKCKEAARMCKLPCFSSSAEEMPGV